MAISAKSEGNTQTISISGRFDFTSHNEFRDCYRNLQPGAAVKLDFSQCDYLDSSALGMLLLLREHLSGDDSHIEISGTNREVRGILDVANFDSLFKIS